MSGQRRAEPDDGFTMMEVVIAIAIFGVTMTVALALVLGTADVVRSNTQRVAAANLATTQIEAARSQRALDVADGATTRTEQVGATTYTITQDADYVVAGTTTSTCLSSGDQLTYKLVSVTVEWPDMAPVAPVRSDTLLALGVGDDDLDPTRGALAVGVTDAADEPLPGVAVTLSNGASRVTGPDGCVVFTNLAPASYTASVDRAGHVGTLNTRVSLVTSAVSAGRVARARIKYDAEREVRLALVAPTGFATPVSSAIHFRSSYVDAGAVLQPCGPAATSACLTASPLGAQHLFPAVYEFWAGRCSDARTSAVSTDATTASPTAVVQVPLAGVRVRVRSDQDEDEGPRGRYLDGVQVRARHAPEGVDGCASGEDLTLPVTTGGRDGGSFGALPFGTWTISAAGASEVVTVTPSDPVADLEISLDD